MIEVAVICETRVCRSRSGWGRGRRVVSGGLECPGKTSPQSSQQLRGWL